MTTYSPRASDVSRHWHVLDASGKTLGKIAVEAARLLMGKHKPMFSRHLDTGDYVIIVNAATVQVTGRKSKQKTYYRHSGYAGGLRSVTFEEIMQKKPSWAIEHAVHGMLPHGPLGAAMGRRLKVYASETHPHQGQILREAPEGSI